MVTRKGHTEGSHRSRGRWSLGRVQADRKNEYMNDQSLQRQSYWSPSLGWLGFLGLLGFSGFENPLGFLFFGFLAFFAFFVLPPRSLSR